jgi:hypothetical protein
VPCRVRELPTSALLERRRAWLLAASLAAVTAAGLLAQSAAPGDGARAVPLTTPRVLLRAPAGRGFVGGTAALAADPDGGFWISWADSVAGGLDAALHLVAVDRGLRVSGEPVVVAAGRARTVATRPAVAALPGRVAAVAWCSAVSNLSCTLVLGMFRDGVPVGPPRAVAEGEEAAFTDSVDVAACGDRLAVVWKARGATNSFRARMFDSGGRPLAEAVELGTGHLGISERPAVGCGGGRFLATWMSGGSIWARALGADGAAAGPIARMDDGRQVFGRTAPTVAVSGGGEGMFTWEEIHGDRATLVARWFGADGQPRGGPTEVSGRAAVVDTRLYGARAAWDSTGHVLFVWDGLDTAGNARAFGRFFDVQRGLPIESEFEITSGESGYPEAVASVDGGFVIAGTDPVDQVGREVWVRAATVPPLGATPRSPAAVQCSDERLNSAIRLLRSATAPSVVTLVEAPDAGFLAAVADQAGKEQRPAGSPGGGGAEAAAAVAGPRWFTIQDGGQIAAVSAPVGARAGGSGAGERGAPEEARGRGAGAAVQVPVSGLRWVAGERAGGPFGGCVAPIPSREDAERAEWLAARLRVAGTAPSVGIAIRRGEGVDTFVVYLYLQDGAGETSARTGASTPQSAGNAGDAGHLGFEVRLFCTRAGELARVRLRSLPTCLRSATSEEGCSSLRVPYRVSMTREPGRLEPAATLSLRPNASGEAWLEVAAAAAAEGGGPAEVCPSGGAR